MRASSGDVSWLEEPRRGIARGALLAAAIAALTYAGALANGFAYDDGVLILGDPGLRSLGGLWQRLGQPSWPGAFGDVVGGWRPVTTAVWALTWAVDGANPAVFHALGIMLHALSTVLVVLVLGRLTSARTAFLGGALFAVHPVHVEAVSNVAGTAEPLAALFALAAVWVHLGAAVRMSAGRVAAIAGLYALATLSKEGAAVLPLLLLLLDAFRDDPDVRDALRWFRERAILYGVLALVLALVAWGRVLIVGGVTVASHPPGGSILLDMPRVWTVLGAWPHYVRLLLFPASLYADYGPDLVRVAFGWTAEAWVGLALGLATFALAGALWRSHGRGGLEASTSRLVALGILWIPLALLPVANVLYLGPVLVAERTLYLPSMGVAIAGGVLLDRALDSYGRSAMVAVALLVLAGGVRSATRVPDWNSSETILTALIEDHPGSGRGWFALGQRLMTQGRHPEARRAFAHAIGILNSEYKESTEIASHLMAMGRPGQARLFLERAWRERPEWPTAPGLLASAELGSGDLVRAEEAARAAVALQPDNPSLHHLLAEALSRQGRYAEAVAARRAALDQGFRDRATGWLLLVGEWLNVGDTSGAYAALDSAAVRAASPEEREAVERARRFLGDTLDIVDPIGGNE